MDGPRGTSERGRGRAHDERMLLLDTHSADTHHAPQTSGLDERARAAKQPEEIERPCGLMAGRQGSLEVEEQISESLPQLRRWDLRCVSLSLCLLVSVQYYFVVKRRTKMISRDISHLLID
jgi:hypothetical protein